MEPLCFLSLLFDIVLSPTPSSPMLVSLLVNACCRITTWRTIFRGKRPTVPWKPTGVVTSYPPPSLTTTSRREILLWFWVRNALKKKKKSTCDSPLTCVSLIASVKKMRICCHCLNASIVTTENRDDSGVTRNLYSGGWQTRITLPKPRMCTFFWGGKVHFIAEFCRATTIWITVIALDC